jgi:hypothetical protein
VTAELETGVAQPAGQPDPGDTVGPIDAGSLYGRVMAAHTMTRDIASWGLLPVFQKTSHRSVCVPHTQACTSACSHHTMCVHVGGWSLDV